MRARAQCLISALVAARKRKERWCPGAKAEVRPPFLACTDFITVAVPAGISLKLAKSGIERTCTRTTARKSWRKGLPCAQAEVEDDGALTKRS
eukprot:2418116-Pleurochrysis_carterae.AAC.2